jgi:hypothetical protein
MADRPSMAWAITIGSQQILSLHPPISPELSDLHATAHEPTVGLTPGSNSERYKLSYSYALAQILLSIAAIVSSALPFALCADRAMLNRESVGQRAGRSARRGVSGARFFRGVAGWLG